MLKRKFLLTSMLLAIGLMVSSLIEVQASSIQSKRLWGKDRYETCSAIVKEGWKKCECAVIVNGEDFPDALSASILAKKYDAPVLLNSSNELNKVVKDELLRLQVKKVFIIGGEKTISTNVENEMKNMKIITSRYSGQDRTETSIEVAKEIGVDKGVIYVEENDFSDAVSIAPIAAKLQIPIVLVGKEGVSDNIKKITQNKKVPVSYILGDEELLDKNVETSLRNAKRITGITKYEKNINIIKEFSDKLNFNNIYIAYSEEFPDALSVSAMAALSSSPVILVGDEVNKDTLVFLKDKIKKASKISVVGGISGVDEDVLNDIINGSIDEKQKNINVNGNTSGNLSNYGYYASQQKWTYYSNFDDGGKLYKMKIDGSHKRKMCEDKASFINVIGDWVYYISSEGENSCVKKIKTDGSYKTILISDKNQIRFLNVYKDKVFYFTWSNENDKSICNLNEITVDGIEVGKVFSFEEGFSPWYLNICGDYAYCLIDVRGSSGIYKLDLNKKLINKLVDDALCINVCEEWIYYGTHNGIYKIKVDGTDKKKITDNYPGPLPNGQWGDPTCFNVEGSWIYYKDFCDQSVYRIDKDGKNKTQLMQCIIGTLSVSGEYLYLHEYKYDENRETYNYTNTVNIKK